MTAARNSASIGVVQLEEDDVAFEPTAWDLAIGIGLAVDPNTDRAALDELADAMLVSMRDGPELERLTDEALDAIWTLELEEAIRARLLELGEDGEWKIGAESALAEFDRAPRSAEVSREVVRELALQLGHQDTPIFFCFDCLNEATARASDAERRGIAARCAIVARRDAAVPHEEIARHVVAPGRGEALGTRVRREAVRTRLGRLASFGSESLPALADELRVLANEPLPVSADEDDVWSVVCGALLVEVAAPEMN